MRQRIKIFARRVRLFLYYHLKETIYLRVVYFVAHRRFLHLENPRKLTEKLYWLKGYYRTKQDLIYRIYDKYIVREYVKNKVGEKYLTHLIGVYNNPEEIDFEILPEKYVLKITQSSGYNLFCRNRSSFDVNKAKTQLAKWLKEKQKVGVENGLEESFFFDGQAKILCEELKEDKNGNIPLDVRFWCFNGKVKFYCMDYDTVDEEGNKKKFYYRNTYNCKGKLIPVNLGRRYSASYDKMELPCFSEMLEVAERLAKDFVFVRVDLYNIDGRIVFGELTPIPQSGNGRITPMKYDYIFGKLLKIPRVDTKEIFYS